MDRIAMNGLEYQFNEGKTTSVKVSYRQYGNGNSFSSTVVILPEDLEERKNIDELTRVELDQLARNIMKNWLDEADSQAE